MVVAAAVMLHALPGHAADGPATSEPVAALTDQARELHLEGVSHFRNGEYDKAYAAFKGAWGLKEHYQIAGALGACELKLGKYRDAAEHLDFFLRSFPKNGDVNERTKTEALFQQAAAKVAQVTVTTPQAAQTTINDRPVVSGEVSFYDPGPINLRATLAGYEPVSEARTLAAGSRESIELMLKPQAKSSPPPPPPTGPDWRMTAGIATGVAAAIGFGVGIGGTVAAGGFADDVAALQTGNASSCAGPVGAHCEALATATEDHDGAQDVATGGFIAGGVLAAVSGGLLVWWAMDPADSGSQDKSGWMAVPTVSLDGGGFSIRGAW